MSLLPEFQELCEPMESDEMSTLTWKEIMQRRVDLNEKVSYLANQGLSLYEEKIGMKQMFVKCGVPTSKVRIY